MMAEASGTGDRGKERRQKQGTAPRDTHNDMLPPAKTLFSVV